MSRLKAKNLDPVYLDAYIAYLENPNKRHTVGIGNGRARPASVQCFVRPFNVDLPANVLAKVSALQSAQLELSERLIGYTFTGLGTNEAIGLRDYQAARIVHTTGKLSRSRSVTSHRTTRPYGSYRNGESTVSHSFPFGKGPASQDPPATELSIFESVRTTFEVDGAIPQGTSLTMTKEKFSART